MLFDLFKQVQNLCCDDKYGQIIIRVSYTCGLAYVIL